MASDCTVEIDDGYINLRVGAIIMKNGKFLMVGNQKDNYLYSVGGRYPWLVVGAIICWRGGSRTAISGQLPLREHGIGRTSDRRSVQTCACGAGFLRISFPGGGCGCAVL